MIIQGKLIINFFFILKINPFQKNLIIFDLGLNKQ